MITGLPPYSSPPVQSLRCKCGLRFVVLIGNENVQAARMEALRLGADFIDVRQLLGFECYCGEIIDVSQDASYTVQ